MTRFVVTLIAFALPFVLFWVYMRLQGRRQAQGVRDPWPMAVLWLTGAVLAVEALALTAITKQAPGGRYIPAHIEDGRIVPGQFVQPDPAPQKAPTETPK